MEQKEVNFNEYVKEQAKDLLNELKKDNSNFGEVKNGLKKLQESTRWLSSSNYYLVVIEEAKKQLQQEIDATTV